MPSYHPLVISQGWNATQVDLGVQMQRQQLVATGYSIKALLMGPERGMQPLKDELKARKYDGVMVGFGVRSSPLLEVTLEFENAIKVLRKYAPRAIWFFNNSPTTAVEAAQRNFHLSKCEQKPGKDLGIDILCEPAVCNTAPEGWLDQK